MSTAPLLKKEIQHCKILIIEDDYLGRTMLKEIYKKNGFLHVEEAANGREALEKVHLFRPDLVILDVVMPEMDGVECCQRIRSDPDPVVAHVPILVQTMLTQIEDKTRLFEAGATDYITKPIDAREITARSLVHLEREVMLRRLREFNVRMTEELDTAHATQQVLVPAPAVMQEIERQYDIGIYEHFKPCSELGGDFWGVKSLSANVLAVYMVDFSGHGVNAALNTFRLHALMHNTFSDNYTPGAYLAHLNAIVAPLLPPGQFATMFYGLIDIRQNSLAYASAGAPQPILFNRKKAGYDILDSSGILLGAARETTYVTREYPFQPGDTLLLYSDALIETRNADGQMLSLAALAELFSADLDKKTHACDHAFHSLLERFRSEYLGRLNDDLTLNAYHRRA